MLALRCRQKDVGEAATLHKHGELGLVVATERATECTLGQCGVVLLQDLAACGARADVDDGGVTSARLGHLARDEIVKEAFVGADHVGHEQCPETLGGGGVIYEYLAVATLTCVLRKQSLDPGIDGAEALTGLGASDRHRARVVRNLLHDLAPRRRLIKLTSKSIDASHCRDVLESHVRDLVKTSEG